MALVKPLELLTRIVAGHVLSETDLDAFISGASKEGQLHDFKSGKKPDELKDDIRQYVTAFANSDGGMLVIGVDESKPARRVDGFKAPGGNAEEWASRLLQGSASYFTKMPTFQTVKHGSDEVLIIAVERSEQLVPYFKNSRICHAFRLGDSTCDAPDYLMADLVLGRRRHPVLDPRSFDVQLDAPIGEVGNYVVAHSWVQAEVANLSLARAKDVRFGVVTWTLSATPPTDPNSLLLTHVEAIQPTDSFGGLAAGGHWQLRDGALGEPFNLLPFGIHRCRGLVTTLPIDPGRGILEFALYLLPEGSPPSWFQVTWEYVLASGYGIKGTAFRGVPKVEKSSGPPRIHWRHRP